jgi:hypothetical protein
VLQDSGRKKEFIKSKDKEEYKELIEKIFFEADEHENLTAEID